jgi:hypothetical protein
MGFPIAHFFKLKISPFKTFANSTCSTILLSIHVHMYMVVPQGKKGKWWTLGLGSPVAVVNDISHYIYFF